MAATAAVAGIGLLGWQREVVRDWSSHRPDGSWTHTRCGGSIPRQTGKSVDAIAWTTFLAAVLGYSVLWTDHNYSTTCEMLRRFRRIFGSKPHDPSAAVPAFNALVAETSNKTAQEFLRLSNGGLISFSTRTKTAALGFSFDVVVYDEAQELTSEQQQAIMATTTSGPRKNSQVLLLGTPTRAGSSADVFQATRAEAMAGGPSSEDLCWVEWGVDEVGDIYDEGRWEQANPSLGTIADVKAIRSAARQLGNTGPAGELAFAQEYLGYWLPTAADALISDAEWSARTIPDGEAAALDGRVAYGVKFSPDGSSVALAAAVRPADGPVHVELVEVAPTARGTAWLASWLEDRSDRAACVAVDGLSSAGALCDRMAGRVPRGYVVRPRAGDVVDAASMLLDAVRTGGLTHIDDPALAASATRSTRRPIGSRGGWGFGGDSAPVEAASLALWAVRTTKRNPARKQVLW